MKKIIVLLVLIILVGCSNQEIVKEEQVIKQPIEKEEIEDVTETITEEKEEVEKTVKTVKEVEEKIVVQEEPEEEIEEIEEEIEEEFDIEKQEVVTPTKDYVCNSNEYNCGDFKTHTEAQDVFDICGGLDNDIHRLDGDNDGVACEGLK